MNTLGYSPKQEEPIILLIDGAHAVRRAQYQPNLKQLSNSRGMPTGAVYGFFTSLKSAVSSLRANSVVVIWEGGHSQRRSTIYPEYKDRGIDPDAPPELDDYGMTDYQYYTHQVSWIQQILECFGITQLKVDGKEGDDTLYQATRLLSGKKIIVSEDRDFFTIVRDDIACFRPIKKEYVDLGNFQQVTSYQTPRHYLYAKCMLGDGSDNIPSIAKGVGEKTVWDVLDKIKDPEDVTSQSILREASKFSGSRYNKIVTAGEAPINRNLDLIDISRESFNIFELQSLVDTIEQKKSPDTVMTTKLFRALEFSQDTTGFITNSLVNMSTYPLSALLNKSYLKTVMMNQSSIL